MLICFSIYRTLIFRTIYDNVQFFVGMATISTYYSLSILTDHFNIKINGLIILILLTVIASLAHSFIQLQVIALKQADPDRIYSSRAMAHYLR
jgi:hypothetical protein